MKASTIFITLIGIIAILGISILFINKEEVSAEALLNDLKNKPVEEITTYLDEVRNEPDGFGAGITGEKLMLSDGERQIELNVPEDKFYLSFAPYINDTHPCGNHNLVTCKGEMGGKTIHVLIEDESGNVVVNDDYEAMDNGFIGLWLPRNIDSTITVSYNGLTASENISTYSDSNTCLTTLELK